MADARLEIVLAARDASQAAFAQVKNSIRELSSSIFSLKGLIAGVGAGFGLQRLARSVIDTAASFEQLEVKLDTLTRGRGKETLEALNAWAKDMPINTREAVEVFAMMQAYGLSPTIEKMQTLVDVSSIFGEDAAPRVARALGQIQARGKLSAQELMQLSEVGINAGKYLEQAFGAPVEEIQKANLRIEEVVEAIWRGLDADYSGAAQKAMNSWRGLTMQFESNWMELERRFAQAGLFEALKEGLAAVNEQMSRWIANNEEFFRQDLPRYLREIVEAARGFAELARLRSITGTLFEGGQLAAKGAFDLGEFLRADVFQRQRMVDQYREAQRRIAAGLTEAYEEPFYALESLGRKPLPPAPPSPLKPLLDASRQDLSELKRLQAEIERESERFAEAKLVPSRLEEALATGVGPNQIARMEAERLARIREEAAKAYGAASEDWIGRHREEIGPYDAEQAKKNLEEIRRQSEEASAYWIELSQRTAERIQDNFSDLFFDAFTGKLKSASDYFGAFARSLQRIAADLAGQMATQAIFGLGAPAAGRGSAAGGGGLLGWLGGIFAGVRHAGGPAGSGPRRLVPAWLFSGAPRLHGGLAPDEFPAILERGEQVIPRRAAARARPQVVVHVQAPGGHLPRESLQGLQTALYATLDRAARRNL